MGHNNKQVVKYAVDVGSTIIKIAKIGADGRLTSQDLFQRDFDSSIASQTTELLSKMGIADSKSITLCSSANGGLRVGIVCLTQYYSGAAIRNQVLLAGANPIFLHDLNAAQSSTARVDILILGGGIDCAESSLRRKLDSFDPANYNFGILMYCGNNYLCDYVTETFQDCVCIENPLSTSLNGSNDSVFDALRQAYLADLVYKEGITELGRALSTPVHPTPEVVSRGFQAVIKGQSAIGSSGASLLMDIGGATTDLHYTTEIIQRDSDARPPSGKSTARYVFTDLGIVASKESTVSQIQNHPRVYEFLEATKVKDVVTTYQTLREGDYDPPPQLLGYACLFLALDRFMTGSGPGLPTADISKLSEIILTGGATQDLDLELIDNIMGLFVSRHNTSVHVKKDDRYQIWVEGAASL